MKGFTSIESLRHVVASVRRYTAEHNIPVPTLRYRGTVKLHGTNSGVRVTKDAIQPQGRSRELSIGADNFGFAAFCHGKEAFFRELTGDGDTLDFTLYGEWIGAGIQKSVAVSQLPKHFVIFSGYDADSDIYLGVKDIHGLGFDMTPERLAEFNAVGIWFIDQVLTYDITIDFMRPEDVLTELDHMTMAVEKQCPWGRMHGVVGTGEGIVWIPVDEPYSNLTGLWFKTKGLEHKAKTSTGHKTEIAPEKLAEIRDVVARLLPEWRLEQGVSHLKEVGLPIDPTSMGAYLQWISRDILKEEADIITANGMDWKALTKYIMPEARQWLLKKVDALVFQQ